MSVWGRRAASVVAALLVSGVAFLAAGPSAQAANVNETTGSVTNTWTNYTNAGGTAGPRIPRYTTVQISCKLTGFRVADGNTWWYRIASAPWNNNFYASADAFYNNGATSGSLLGTPWVDPAVPDCGSISTPARPSAVLHQGPAAPKGYRYAITLNNFAANTGISVSCRDSIDPAGFYTFVLRTNASGYAFTQSYCYSADGPDHWVVAGGVASNRVRWGSGSTGVPVSQPVGSGNGGSGGTAVANPTYNRSATVSWALNHAKDPQGSGALCTWFVSQALWAGRLPQTSQWNPKSRGAAVYVQQFVDYFRKPSSGYSVTWTDITRNLITNAVPGAVAGDVIVYNWNDGGAALDHMSLVVDIAAGQYPEVSEMGQFDFTKHPEYKLRNPRSPYVKRGWTYSAMHHAYLQKQHPGMKAYLLHFNGGYFIGTY